MTLREKVAEAIHNYDSHPHWKPWSELSDASRSIRMGYGDAAIAAVFEALLSDTAVEAGARGIHSTERLMTGEWSIKDIGEHQLLNGPRTLDEDEREGYRYVAKRSLKAAMAALTADDAQTGEPQ